MHLYFLEQTPFTSPRESSLFIIPHKEDDHFLQGKFNITETFLTNYISEERRQNPIYKFLLALLTFFFIIVLQNPLEEAGSLP